MPIVEKEIIGPGHYWYRDEASGQPRKLEVTPELTKHWADSGNEMLKLGLTVPVPCEHDFTAHPMTPKDKLLNNAGWVTGYKRRDVRDDKTGKVRKDVLFGVVDVQDEELAKKLPRTIRWTSPWINSFTDGNGRQWKNVISHLALTTRPRVVDQQPFQSIAAALSVATPVVYAEKVPKEGYCISRAGLLRKDGRAAYPVALSMWAGIPLAAGDMGAPGADGAAAPGAGTTPPEPPAGVPDDDDDDSDDLDLDGLMNPTKDSGGDVKMEELLCDLLQALGVPMPDESNEHEFKRHLYEAAMSKIKELTGKGMAGAPDQPPPFQPDQNKPPQQQPNISGPNKQQNPLLPQVQQEQQPLYMGLSGGSTAMSQTNTVPSVQLSLEDINKIEDQTTRSIALAFYNEREALRAERDADRKALGAVRAAQLADATRKRATRIQLLGKMSPKSREKLEGMAKLQSCALSLGDDGQVVDPMKDTLDMLETAIGDIPKLLVAEREHLTMVAQPTDADALTTESEGALVEEMVRMMGGEPEKRAG